MKIDCCLLMKFMYILKSVQNNEHTVMSPVQTLKRSGKLPHPMQKYCAAPDERS